VLRYSKNDEFCVPKTQRFVALEEEIAQGAPGGLSWFVVVCRGLPPAPQWFVVVCRGLFSGEHWKEVCRSVPKRGRFLSLRKKDEKRFAGVLLLFLVLGARK
jgi:hypothetical protein